MIAKGPWVLVVDDDNDFVEMLSEKLKDAGYRVLSCGKTHEAARMINNQKFSCIVLDYRLSNDGDGGQVVQSFKKKPNAINFETPILFMSGQFDADILQRVGKFVSGAVVKPFDLQEFINKVGKLCAADAEAERRKSA